MDKRVYSKAKSIVRYALEYSLEDTQDRLNTIQVLTDGIKTSMQWSHVHDIRIFDACTMAVEMFARFESIYS